MDELEAIRAYQSGRADAFAVLFELHAAHVYRTSYLITWDVGRAEDVAQETFLILAQRLPGLSPGPLRSWLGRVAANLSLNERRRAWDLPLEGLPPHSRATLEARDALAGADTVVEQVEEVCRAPRGHAAAGAASVGDRGAAGHAVAPRTTGPAPLLRAQRPWAARASMGVADVAIDGPASSAWPAGPPSRTHGQIARCD
jgi:hypothetical protein